MLTAMIEAKIYRTKFYRATYIYVTMIGR